MNLRNLRIEDVRKSRRKSEVEAIYVSAFRREDRMPFGLMTAMSYLWNTDFLAFYDEEALCGFLYAASIGRQSFVMFLAVDERLRAKGYGSLMLRELGAKYPENRILVTIEPCDSDAADLKVRLRRKKFYLSNGFSETGYFLKMGGKRQEILIKNGVFSKAKLRLFFMIYSNLTLYPRIWKE